MPDARNRYRLTVLATADLIDPNPVAAKVTDHEMGMGEEVAPGKRVILE